MIKFNQLSITPDGRKMIVDVMVKDHDFLKDVYLDSIIIDAGDTYNQGGPSNKPYLIRKFRWEDSMDKPKRCCSLLIKNSHVILKYGYIYGYNGKEIKPEIAVILGGEILRKGIDYDVEYSNNINVGLGQIKIIGKGQFKGERTKIFDIVDFNTKSIQNCVITVPQTYYKYEEKIIYKDIVVESVDDNGNPISNITRVEEIVKVQIKPIPTVIHKNKTLVKDVDYKVVYGKNNEVGVGTMSIVGINEYINSRDIEFTIVTDLPEINPKIVIDPSINNVASTEQISAQSDDEPVDEEPEDTDSNDTDNNSNEECDCGCKDFSVPEDFDPKNVKIKHGRIIIDWQDLIAPLHNSVFFVYAKAKGNPTPDAPCGRDNIFTLGIAVNLYPVYNSFLCALKELDSDCNVPKNVIDMYLRYFAFNINVKTGHYIEAIRIWDKWFKPLTRNFKHHSHVGIVADIYPNHAYTHGHHPLRDYQAHNHGIDHHYWHNHYGFHHWHELDGHLHHHPHPHHHLPWGYFDYDDYWFYGLHFNPFSPVHHHIDDFHYHGHPFHHDMYHHNHHHTPDDVHQDEYGHRYWEHEHVDMPVSLQLFGGPMNTSVGMYNEIQTVGGCNCGK